MPTIDPNTVINLKNPFDGYNSFSDEYISKLVSIAKSASERPQQQMKYDIALRNSNTGNDEPDESDESTKKHSNKTQIIGNIATFVCVLAIILTIRFTGILNFNRVDGVSMEPNFHTGNIVMTTNLTKLNRYDIVTATTPTGMPVIKRVIGLPGDSIEVKNGHIYVNGKKASEKFVKDKDYTQEDTPVTYQLSSNQYFIAGDNRLNSTDSRYYGPVTKQEIHGEVIFTIPLGK